MRWGRDNVNDIHEVSQYLPPSSGSRQEGQLIGDEARGETQGEDVFTHPPHLQQ